MNRMTFRSMMLSGLFALATVSTTLFAPVDANAAPPTASAYTYRSFNMTATRVGKEMVVNLSAKGFPARQALQVEIAVPNSTAKIEVARGITGANGQASFRFTLPTEWPGSAAVVEKTFDVTVRTANGAAKQSAALYLYR